MFFIQKDYFISFNVGLLSSKIKKKMLKRTIIKVHQVIVVQNYYYIAQDMTLRWFINYDLLQLSSAHFITFFAAKMIMK